jgi:hypothetical protein
MDDQISAPRTLRILSVSSSYYDYQLNGGRPRPPEVPLLRLRGYWLRQAGFPAGQRVQVHVADGCITIVPAQAQ